MNICKMQSKYNENKYITVRSYDCYHYSAEQTIEIDGVVSVVVENHKISTGALIELISDYEIIAGELFRIGSKAHHIFNRKPCGVYGISNTIGLVVHDIHFDVDETVIYYVLTVEGEYKSLHRSKIHEDNDRPFFFWGNYKIYLDTVMRV